MFAGGFERSAAAAEGGGYGPAPSGATRSCRPWPGTSRATSDGAVISVTSPIVEPTSHEQPDVVFTGPGDMFDDAVQREFCRPPDQTLLALARDDRVGQLFVADAWRSAPISIARRRSLRLVEGISVAGRDAVRIRPHRLRRRDSTDTRAIARSYRAYGEAIGKAVARSRGETRPRPASASLVTYDPFVAGYSDNPWIANVVYFGQDDWATGEGVRPWWSAYRDAYARIDERGAAIFVVSRELADRVSPRAIVVPNGVNPMCGDPTIHVRCGSTTFPRRGRSIPGRSTAGSRPASSSEPPRPSDLSS